VVTAVGAGVTEFAVGDAVVSTFFPQWQAGKHMPCDFQRVPGDGVDGFARESVTLPATAFTHAPRDWSHAEAATLTTAGLTAWRALVVDGRLQAGDTVLVLGTGGVSIFALQMAKSMGARVIATTSSAAKAERLKALGADVVGMSTVPEAIVSRASGMNVLAFAMVTNAAAGLAGDPTTEITHDEVLEVAKHSGQRLGDLMVHILNQHFSRK
jgi:NADPH:quinone reductase-like Zn-dependent oxidoreductase